MIARSPLPVSPGPLPEDTVEVSLGVLARGTAVNLFGSGYNLVSRLVLSLVVARLLDPAALGLYFLALTVASLLTVMALGGFGQMLLCYLARHLADRDGAALRGTLRFGLRAVAAASLLGGAALALVAPWVAEALLHNPQVAMPLKIVALSVPFAALELAALNATQAFKEMKYRMWVEAVLNPTLKIVLTLAFVRWGWGLNGALWAHVASLGVCLLAAFWSLRRCLPPDREVPPPQCQPRKLFAYAAPLWGVNVLAMLIPQADLFVLAYFRPLEEVGLYSLCTRLVGVVVGVGSLAAVGQVFAPFASELHHLGQRERLGLFSKVATLWALQLFLPIFLVGTVGAGAILGIFGDAYRPAAPALVLLLVGQLLFVLGGPAGELLSMGGKTRLLLLDSCGVLVAQVVLGVLIIPRWGLMGAAFANGAALAGVKLVQALQAYHHQGIHPLSRWMLKPLGAGLAALLAALWLFRLPAVSGYLQFGLLSAAVVVAYAGLLAGLGLDEPNRLAWQQLRASWRGRRPERSMIPEATELPWGD